MKYSLRLWAIIAFGMATSTASYTDELIVVFDVIGIESLYLKIRGSQLKSGPKPEIDVEGKKRICQAITSSSFFTSFETVPLNMDEIYDELKRNYLEIFNALYEKAPNPLPNGRDMVYTNPTKLVQIVLNEETFSEYVFVCLARHLSQENGKNTIIQYFVSQEYDMSDRIYSTEKYAAGRFLFGYDDDDYMKNQLGLHGIAEQPVDTILGPDEKTERLYFDIRMNHKPVENNDDNILCKLNADQKIRVCALVFNSSHFHSQLEFDASDSNVSDSCEERIISFHADDVKADAAGKVYKEWVISCLVNEIDDGTEIEYYMSLAFPKANDVFVFSGDDESEALFVENLSRNVRFSPELASED